MKRLLPILLLGLLLLNLKPSVAQTLQPDYGAPSTPVNVCNGNAVFKVKIVGGTTACSQGTLNISLPVGYVYVSGSATLSGGTGTVSETSFSGNTATLDVQTIPATPGFTEISYEAYATCAALGAGTSVNNQASYSFNSSCFPASSVTSNSFNTQSASLTITNITNSNYFGAAGDNYTRTVTITNNGWGSVSKIHLADTSGSGLYIKGISVSGGWTFITDKTIVGTDTVTTFTLSGGELTQGQSITLIENVTMVSNCSLQSKFATWFGCDGSPCTTNNVGGVATAGATVNNSYVPSLKVIPDLQNLSCRGENHTQTIRLTNAGSVRLNDLSLNLFSTSSSSAAALQTFDATTTVSAQAAYSGFQYKFGLNGVWVPLTPTLSGNFNTPASCFGSASSNVLFNIPVINPGDTLFITYTEKNCPVTAPVNNTLFTAGTLLRYDYEAPCGGRTTPVSSLLRNPLQTQLVPQASLPATLVPDQSYVFKYHFPTAQSGVYVNTGANASTLRLELTLPNNINFSGNAADLSLKHPVTGAVLANPSSFNFNAGTNTVTATYTITPGFSVSTLQNAVLAFDNLTLDCNIPSTGNTVTLNGYLKSSSTCAAEEWLFSEVTPVTLACPQPPCDVLGGMEFSGFSIQRTNLGVADNDNNGVADAAGTPDTSKVRSDLAMPGDTVMAVFNGRFVGGMISPSFQYAYAVDTFSAGASHLTSLYARVEIYLFGETDPFYICDNVPVLGGNSNTRKVDVSISTLNSITPLPPGYAEYLDGDSMAVYVYYKVTGNPGPVFVPVQVKNSFYLSDVPDPSDPAHQFTCGNSPQGSFSLVGYGTGSTGARTYSLVGNGNVVTEMDHFLSLGGITAGSKPFINEYRPISIHDEFRYTVPANYTYVSASVTYTYTTGVGTTASKTVAVTPVNAAANPLVFDIASLFQNGTFPAGDQGHSLTAMVTIKPECEAVPRSEALFYMSQVATPGFNTGFANASINEKDSIYLTAPEIIASTANATPTATDATVSWEIQISNPTIATALRVWMGKASGAGITINSVQRLSGPGGFVLSTIAPTGAGIYQLGTLGQSSNYYRINASYTSCVKDSMQLAYWYDCANTGTYPANVGAAAYKKEIKLAAIPLQPALQTSIVSEPASTPAHDFCDVLTYEIETINTGSSGVKDLTVTAYLPGPDVVYVPGTFQLQYPAGSGSYIPVADAQVTIGSNSIVFTIPASEIPALSSTSGFRVKFGLQTACGFSSGGSFRFASAGSAFCGTVVNSTQQQGQKIAINGIPQYTNLYSMSSTTTTGVMDCTTGDIVATYKFKIINQGPLPTTIADGFRINLPSPWQLDAGSISFTHDPGGASYTGASGGNYNFLMGVGVDVGDSVVFTATVRVPAAAAATYPTGNSTAVTEQAVIHYGGVCSQTGVACPVTELVVGTQNTTVFNYAGGKTGLPVLTVTNPAPVCSPATVDITQPGITAGSTPGLTFTYFTDASGTTVLANPSAISVSGTYYIKGTTVGGCTDIKPVAVVINPLPIAGIVYNGSPFCAAGAVAVTQTGQTGGTYSSTPAGLSLNPTTGAINLASSTPGTYTVTYSFSNGTCNNTASTAITIASAPTLIITDPAPACAPATVDITAAAITAGSSSGITLSYFTDAAGTTPLANPSAIGTSGTYYIQGTSAGGCVTSIKPVTVVVNPVPTASISYTGSPYCGTGTTSVTQTGQAGGTYSSTAGLSINPATGAIDLGSSTPGTYTVTYTFSNGSCSSSTTTSITIVAAPVLITHDPAPVCSPATVDLTASAVTTGSTAGLTFNYFTDASGTTALANPNAVGTSGTYYIQGTAASGCKTAILPVTVTINPLPVATISYPGSPYCQAATPSGTVTQTGQGGGTYSSTAGLVINPTTGIINIATSTPGTYTITYSFSNGSCNNTATAVVTIVANPVLVINNPAAVCAPASIDLTAGAITAGSTPGLSFAYFTDAAGTTTLSNPSAITSSGTYYIQGTAASGCKTPVEPVTVTINPLPVASISYAGSPFCTSGGNATVTQTGQGGGSYSSTSGLTIDPATGEVNLSASTPGTYTVTYTFSNGPCSNTATTTLTIASQPVLTITDPAPVCAPATIDLTAAAITAGSTPGLSFAYFTDAAGTTALSNPDVVTASGTYYIQGTTAAGCKTTTRPVTVTVNPQPVATIAYTGSPYCAAQTAAATVTHTGQGGGTYSSTPGLSINPSTGEVNIVGSTPGTYTVTYSFTNGTCSNTATATLRIDPLPVLMITNPAAVCAPGTVNITAPTITAGSTPGLAYNYYIDPAGLVTLSKPESISTSGTYYVQGVAPSGCVTGIEAVNVVINLQPTATIAYSSSPFCVNAGGTGTVTQTGLGGGAYTSSPAGLSINATTGAIDISNSTPGTYTVTYSFNNGLCSNTTNATISIQPMPVLVVNDPAPVCLPGTVDITTSAVTAGSTSGLSFQYYTDAACTTPLSNASAISVSGTYYIRGISATGGCVTDAKPVVVTINSQPVITVSGASLVCKGEAVTLTASSPGNTITWQNMSGSNSVIVYPQATTTYTAVATNAAGCVATASVQVQVRDFDVTLTANANPIMPGTTLTLTTGANSAYSVIGWKPASVFQAQTALSQSFIIKDSSQTFTVIGRSVDGCLDTTSLTVALEPSDKDFYIPNAFTPNNDGKNDVFKVYGSSIKSVELRVFNQWGELVYETKDKDKGWDGIFKGKQQPVGVYPFGVKVTFIDNTVITKRGTVNLIR
ncbi:MAG: gliding motility-associated C-terminal domain-containing protein [Chitinophagaceae bacterium]|nr:MAG: gliding motility-associated C-terminal domain-containing protein [Chitinophagaceae bacterium]